MKEDLKLNSVSDSELNNLDKTVNNYDRIYIENSAEELILNKVNTVLSKHDIPVLLWIDEHLKNYSGNLHILRSLTNIKQLDIFVAAGEISSLPDISFIKDLQVLKLRKNFKKGISLNDLKKFSRLKHFELENGLTSKQHSFIDELTSLKTCAVFDLDLNKIIPKLTLKMLRIYRKLLSCEKIMEVFPNLTSLYLEKCKDMDLSYIGQLPHIQEVWLRYMPLVSAIPEFINPGNIKLFQTTHLPKLADVSEIFKMSNLESLMMTDLSLLKADDFSRLSELPNLKTVYITFKEPKENLKFFEFCQRNNWIYKQPALVK